MKKILKIKKIIIIGIILISNDILLCPSCWVFRLLWVDSLWSLFFSLSDRIHMKNHQTILAQPSLYHIIRIAMECNVEHRGVGGHHGLSAEGPGLGFGFGNTTHQLYGVRWSSFTARRVRLLRLKIHPWLHREGHIEMKTRPAKICPQNLYPFSLSFYFKSLEGNDGHLQQAFQFCMHFLLCVLWWLTSLANSQCLDVMSLELQVSLMCYWLTVVTLIVLSKALR